MSREKEPFRIKLAEFSKKVDIVQMIGGGVIAIFNPAVGAVIIGGSAVTYVLASEYQRRERQKEQFGYSGGEVKVHRLMSKQTVSLRTLPKAA